MANLHAFTIPAQEFNRQMGRIFDLSVPVDPVDRSALAMRFNVISANMRGSVLAGVFIVPLLCWHFWDVGNRPMMLLSAAVVIFFSFLARKLLLVEALAEKPETLHQISRIHLILAAGIAAGWTGLCLAVVFHTDASAQYVAGGIQIALLGIGIARYIYFPLAFVLYSTILMGGFIASVLFANQFGGDWLLWVLTLFFCLFMTMTAVAQTFWFDQGHRLSQQLLLAEEERRNKEAVEAEIRRVEEQQASQQLLATERERSTEAEQRKAQAEQHKADADRRTGEMVALANQYEKQVMMLVSEVAKVVGQVADSTKHLSRFSSDIIAQSDQVMRSSTAACEASLSIATSVDEMSMSFREIADQVGQQASASEEAHQLSRESREQVAALSRDTADIDTVVQLVNSVSGQTNLLALNASIEASRAGEAGRGFAVVAEEVKSLAKQSHSSATTISKQIGAIQNSLDDVVATISDTGDRIEGMARIATNIAVVMEQQRDTTQGISHNAAQAANGSDEARNATERLGNRLREAGGLIETLLNTSTELDGLANHLHSQTGLFLDRLRTT